MTRDAFIFEHTSIEDLINFCYDEGLGFCEDVYDDEAYDNRICEEIREMGRSECWTDIRAWLNELPENSDYYYIDAYDEWREVDDYFFEEVFNRILSYCDEQGMWDEVIEEELVEEELVEEDTFKDEKVEEEFGFEIDNECTISELMLAGVDFINNLETNPDAFVAV